VIFVDVSGISWPHHLKRSDYVPVSALRIVAGLSNGISRGQAFDTPLFGHNVLAASHDEDLGVSHHCKCMHAAILGRGKPLSKVLQIRGIVAKRKDLIARNQETERPGACCSRIRRLRIIAGTMSSVDIQAWPSEQGGISKDLTASESTTAPWTGTQEWCGWRIDTEAMKRLDSRNALR
jgi:hypothetical protein